VGFLRRLTGGDPPPPDWAAFLSGSEFRAFMSAVEADLKRRGMTVETGDGFMRAEPPGGQSQMFGLSNLAQVCRATPKDDWTAVIASHFTGLINAQGRDIDAIAADFEQARAILRIRLYPDDYAAGATDIKDEPVLRPIAPGITLGLVYDFPESTNTVPSSHLAGWPHSEDEVLAIARENTLAEPLPPWERLEANGGAGIEILQGDSFYVASRLLGLRALLGPDRDYGAVVGVPNRHTLVWHEIHDLSVVHAISGLSRLVQAMFAQGPGSISDQLYWWRDGEVTVLPVSYDRSGINFAPPDAFVEQLNNLPAGPTG
jgi:hypothetical protein